MTLAVVQARMGSSRLPGKVLMPLGDQSVLQWVIRAAADSAAVDAVIVATSDEAEDDAVADESIRCGAELVRGPLDDVLDRFVLALDRFGDQPVVRLTGDCPLLDPTVIRAAVAAFREGEFDYFSTVDPRSLPRGLDVEVVAPSLLRRLAGEAHGVHRVHVTSWVSRLEDITLGGLVFRPTAKDLRVTLDTPEDAELLREVVAKLGAAARSWHHLVRFLRAHPEIAAINASVRQRFPEEG